MPSDLIALADRWYTPGDFTRKAPSYLKEYERVFAGLRGVDARILELGVSSGASLLMWRDYLPNATIIGIDINPIPETIVNQDRIHFIQASQDDTAALDRAAEIAGGQFDVIIDDASHIGYLTKKSFVHLFPKLLKPEGVYVIEDFGTSFLPEYPDGSQFVEPPTNDVASTRRTFESHQYGMVGVIKQLIDAMMQELITGNPSYLAIARLTILTNVAFIEKSSGPVGRMPASWPLDSSADRNELSINDMMALTSSIHLLDRRVSELEAVLGRTLSHFAPLVRLRRFFSRSR